MLVTSACNILQQSMAVMGTSELQVLVQGSSGIFGVSSEIFGWVVCSGGQASR